MSPAPERASKQYAPTSPEVLLARAKRRSLAIRRHRLLGAGGALAVVIALVLGSIFIPGTSGPGTHPPGRVYVADRIGSAYELTAAEAVIKAASPQVLKGVETAEVGFSLDLLDHLAGSTDASGTSNELVSPSSLATALAMLQLGAMGPTAEGIATTLSTTGLSADEQAAGWHSLAAVLAAETSTNGNDLAKVPELDIANALFLEQHFAVQPAFVRSLSSDFSTGLWQVDFKNDLARATDAINQWTSENTKGLIKRLFTPGALNQYTRLVLADAVYFHADWAHAFKSRTTEQEFHLASGATESVPFMSFEADRAIRIAAAAPCPGRRDRELRRSRAPLRRQAAERSRRDAYRDLASELCVLSHSFVARSTRRKPPLGPRGPFDAHVHHQVR